MSVKVENFSALRVGLATSEDIRSWSSGEVKKVFHAPFQAFMIIILNINQPALRI